METTLDRFGRVVIPKQVRDDLGLKPGAVLDSRLGSVGQFEVIFDIPLS